MTAKGEVLMYSLWSFMASADMIERSSLSDRFGISSRQGPCNADLSVLCACCADLVVCYLCSLCRCEELETVETYLSNHIALSSDAKRFQHSWRQLGGKQRRIGIRHAICRSESVYHAPLHSFASVGKDGLRLRDSVFLCPGLPMI